MPKLPQPPAALERAWPHIRVALIFLHVAAMLVMCLPAPYKMASRRQWHTPQAKAEVASWAKRLRSLGFDVTAASFEQDMYAITLRYLKLRDGVNAPFAPYHRVSRMRQGWSMFTHPQTHPGWLHVDIRQSQQPFRPLYVQGSNDHTWRRDQFENNRVRKLLGRIARRPTGHPAYLELSTWIARRAAADFPGATHVRVRHFRARTAKPGRSAPPGRFVDSRVYPLERYR